MTYRMHWAFVACLGAAALILAANESFAASGTHGGASVHRSIGPARHHHRGNQTGAYWPGIGDSYYDPSYGEPAVDFTQPTPRNSYASDIPWDWAHRYPPVVTDPGFRPYVPDCHEQTVKVPGNGDEQHAVNILRCY
jgi:hypothetical protein